MVDDQRNIARQISAQQNVFTHAQTLSSFTKQDKGRRFYAEVPDILLNDEKTLFATQALLRDAISALKRSEEAPAPSILH